MKEVPSQGFSLLELLLVLILLGIVAVAAVPDLSSGDQKRLELAAGEIAEAMRYARSEALRTAEPRGFQLQTAEARIRVVSADTSSNPWTAGYDVERPGVHNFYDTDLSSRSYAGIDGMTRSAVFHGNCNNADLIFFDALGMPACADNGGALVDQYDVTLSFGSRSRIVSLHGITGRVTVQ
jgi:type II secretion system protein H